MPYGAGEAEKVDFYFPGEMSAGEQGAGGPTRPARPQPASLMPVLPVFQLRRSSCFSTEGTGRAAGACG